MYATKKIITTSKLLGKGVHRYGFMRKLWSQLVQSFNPFQGRGSQIVVSR